jgi:hypothetical protein
MCSQLLGEESGLVIKLDAALQSAAERAGIEDFTVKNYKKPLKPLDAFLNELLKNVDFKINIDPRIKFINSKLDRHLKLIDPESKNILLYCFECEI